MSLLYLYNFCYKDIYLEPICLLYRVSNGTPAVVGLTYANLGNLPGGNLGWEERPVQPIEHRSNRDSDRSSTGSNIKVQTPSSDQHSYHHQHGSNLQRNSRPEITDLVEAMHNLRTRKYTKPQDCCLLIRFSTFVLYLAQRKWRKNKSDLCIFYIFLSCGTGKLCKTVLVLMMILL